ncbi:MAG: BrnT family toxin [Nitrospiria bacterium]
MGMKFEWDDDKARKNLKKHKVSFEEAVTVFGDFLSITISDSTHSETEDRWIIIGESNKHRLIVVVHSERRDRIRIISARQATLHERKEYEANG